MLERKDLSTRLQKQRLRTPFDLINNILCSFTTSPEQLPTPTVASCIRKSLFILFYFIIIVIFYVCENRNYPTISISHSSHAPHCSHWPIKKRPIVNCYKMPCPTFFCFFFDGTPFFYYKENLSPFLTLCPRLTIKLSISIEIHFHSTLSLSLSLSLSLCVSNACVSEHKKNEHGNTKT